MVWDILLKTGTHPIFKLDEHWFLGEGCLVGYFKQKADKEELGNEFYCESCGKEISEDEFEEYDGFYEECSE